MLQRKSTETVTLTRTQLQAILELITKIGGLSTGPTPAWEEPSYEPTRSPLNSAFSRSSDCVPNLLANQRDVNDNQDSYQLSWKKEKVSDDGRQKWVQFSSDKADVLFDKSAKSGPNSFIVSSVSMPLFPTSPGSTCNSGSSSGSDFVFRGFSVPSSAMSNTTNFRRYARSNTPEADMHALEQKRLRTLEYQQALAAQKEEKERRIREEKAKIKHEEELMEKRMMEQQLRMAAEFEEEQKKLKDKQDAAERKRAAVVAAIQQTPTLKKRTVKSIDSTSFDNGSFDNEVNKYIDAADNSTPQKAALNGNHNLNHSNSNSTSSLVATVLPTKIMKEICVQTDNYDASFHYGGAISCKDQGNQTDVQLLLQWLVEVKRKMKRKKTKRRDRRVDFDDHSSIASSTSSSPPSPILSSRHEKENPDRARPRAKTYTNGNLSSKSYVQPNDVELNRKLQEMKRKYWEKEIGNRKTSQNRIQQNKENQEKAKNEKSASTKSRHQAGSRGVEAPKTSEVGTTRSAAPASNQRLVSVTQRLQSPPVPALQKTLNAANHKSPLFPNINGKETNKNPKEKAPPLRPQSRKKWRSQEVFTPDSNAIWS